MGEIVNLRQARKRRDRDARDKTADANRVKHGLSKAEKVLGATRRELEAKKLEGHRLEPDGDAEHERD